MTTRRTEIGNPLPEPLSERPEMVLVTWRDSVSNGEYERAEDAWPYIELMTVGFFMRRDTDGIVVGMEQHDSKNDAGRCRYVVSIPAENIVSVAYLKKSDKVPPSTAGQTGGVLLPLLSQGMILNY